jgi:hypothetical protein
MTHEPTRLLDDATAPAGLRRDLAAAARHRVPYDATAGAARFESTLAKGAGAASSGWGAGTIGAGALLLGGLIGAGLWLSRPADPPPQTEPVIAAVRAAPEASSPVSEDRSDEPSPTVAPAPPEEVIEDMSEETAAPTPEPRAESKRPRGRKAIRGQATREVVSAREGSADYLREARSLQAARGFLGRDPAQALARAEAGAAEFKAGAFTQEWEGLAILALFELDRRGEAERRARAFLARWPNGPYAAQVREALGEP